MNSVGHLGMGSSALASPSPSQATGNPRIATAGTLPTFQNELIQLSSEALLATGRNTLDSSVLQLMKGIFGEAALPPRSIMWAVAERMTQLTWAWLENAFPDAVQDQSSGLKALRVALQEMCPLHSKHSGRVAELALRFARELGLDERERKEIEEAAEWKEVGMLALQLAALGESDQEDLSNVLHQAGDLHDIGKLALPSEILDCPRALTDEEFEIVKLHPIIGEAMLAGVDALVPILPAVRGHHERWDGRGYPDRLLGEETALSARILCVVDSFDAMTGLRPYRHKLSYGDAAAEICRNAGTQFDPDLAVIFADLVLDGQVPPLA